MRGINYQLAGSLDETQQEAIDFHLGSYNRANNAAYYKARALPENAVKPLHILALNAEDLIVGGLNAETQFLWLKIHLIAVADELRRHGIGRQLIALAEQEAIARHCRYAYVDTSSFQAPDFYRKLGYHVAGALENWDSHGHTKFLFTKELE